MTMLKPHVFVAAVLIIAALTGAFVAVAASSAAGMHFFVGGQRGTDAPSQAIESFAVIDAGDGSSR